MILAVQARREHAAASPRASRVSGLRCPRRSSGGAVSALDEPIQQACEREKRILITLDTDFADTRRYNPARSPGVIVLRPPSQAIAAVVACLDGAIRALATERIEGTLWIVEAERLRIRDHPGDV
ncbi:MAG: DUF5615 family PIN-like protein [Vicinamibacteria bacterium]|nr:DUF5615 family PIN-like protein [Vicinamibacteria bacterium]